MTGKKSGKIPGGPSKTALTKKADAVTEERNREAARTSIKAAQAQVKTRTKTKPQPKKKPKSELEVGLEDSFPASDPLTATRPGGPVEDRRERTPRK